MKKILIILLGIVIINDTVIAQNTLDKLGLGASTPAAVAYSLRLLSTSYTGAAIQVRRSSDNATQDIGFTAGGDLDEAALLAFTGSGNGFVTTWYDQSGGARDMIKADVNQQPQIVFSGAFKYIGSRVAIDFAGNKGLVYTGSLTLYSITTVVKSESAVWPDFHTILDGSPRIGGILTNNGTNFWQDVPQIAIWKNGVVKTNAESLSPVDQGMVLSISSQTSTVSRIFIGNYDAGGSGGSILENEAVAFSSLLSNSNRQIVECNQGTYYSIATVCTTSINTQPSTTPHAECLGNTAASLSVDASGLNLTYQWYENSTAANSGGSPVSGATSNSFTPSTTVVGTTYYYVEVTGGVGPIVTSDVSGSIVVEAPPVISITPPAVTIINGNDTTLTASGADTFVWGNDNETPLDQVTNYQLAVGLRLLRTAYTGAAIRLRRANDNAESDFGFVGTSLDVASINTFLGGDDGYCTIIYDQSGFGRNIVQPNSYQQPLLVLNGLNGKPVLHYAAGQYMYNTTNITPPYTITYTGRQIGPSRGRVLAGLYNNWLLGWWNGNMAQAYFEGWVSDPGGSSSDSNPYVYTGSGDGAVSAAYQNASLIKSNSNGVQGPNGISINGSESSDADVAELFVFNTVLSNMERSGIEKSSGSFYGVFGAPPVYGAAITVNPTATRTYKVTGYSAGKGCAVKDSVIVTVVNAPLLGNFGPFNKTSFDKSFALGAPKSKSAGVFNYTSSNPAVATIVGDSIIIHSVGVSTITATQAQNGIYYGDSISTLLTVNLVTVVTKNGGFTTTDRVYVNNNGAIGDATGLSQYGQSKVTLSRKDGLTATSAGTSALQIKTDFPGSSDGVYWIDLPTVGPTKIYCIMNSAVDGGGWMMMMKATQGNTFEYNSSYWTTNNTLNETDVSRNDGDAKYQTMNYFEAKDMLALWPDIPSDYNGSATGGSINLSSNYNNWCWLQNNFNSGTAITPIELFNTADRLFISDAELFDGKGTAFSGQTDVRFYGFNFRNSGSVHTRWGFGWNENGGGLFPNGNMDSDDVSGGIGMSGSFGSYSAGDRVNCCENSVGINRSARVEVYVR